MNVALVLLSMLAIAGILYWLGKANAQDRRKMGAILGLEVIEKSPSERGEDPIMGHFHQSAFLRGELHGYPASVWQRSVRRTTRRNSNNQSLFTVLCFDLPAPSEVLFRIEPALAGKLQSHFGGDQPARATGDAEFDKLFRFTSTDPEAGRVFLTPEMRRLLLDFRKKVTGEMPEHALGRFAGDLLLGTFSLERHRMTYAVSGTPSEKIARHFQVAAGILTEFGNPLRALP